MFERGDKCFIVENSRTVKAAKVISRQGEFYTIQTVGSCGAIRLKESRLFMTEEEANNHINGKRIIIDDKGNNDDIGFIDVFEGKRVCESFSVNRILRSSMIKY